MFENTKKKLVKKIANFYLKNFKKSYSHIPIQLSQPSPSVLTIEQYIRPLPLKFRNHVHSGVVNIHRWPSRTKRDEKKELRRHHATKDKLAGE